jgi:hypothetical protein
VAESLTDDQLRTLSTLLWRFASADMDQWELWRFPTIDGEIYVDVSRQPSQGGSPEAYTDISRWIDFGGEAMGQGWDTPSDSGGPQES